MQGQPGVTPVHVAARRQGLGEVRRIYRERNPLWTGSTWLILGVGAVATLAGAVADPRWRWPLLFLGPVLALAAVAATAFLAPVSGVEHRRLIGASPAGLLVYTEDHGSAALPWADIVEFTRQSGRYRYLLVDTDDVEWEFRDIHDGRSLLRAVRERSVRTAPVTRRAVIAVAAATALAVLGWLAVRPAFTVAREDRLPTSLDGFAGVCREPGAAYRTAARYAAAAPRPVAIIGDGGLVVAGTGPWNPTAVADVQVVVCVRRATGGEWANSCGYAGRGEKTYVRMEYGRYEMTAYEARTRRLVRTRSVVGENIDCPRAIAGGTDTLYTRLKPEQYRRAMGDIVG